MCQGTDVVSWTVDNLHMNRCSKIASSQELLLTEIILMETLSQHQQSLHTRRSFEFQNYQNWLLNWSVPIQHQCLNKALLEYLCWSWSFSIVTMGGRACVLCCVCVCVSPCICTGYVCHMPVLFQRAKLRIMQTLPHLSQGTSFLSPKILTKFQ